jgi:hypothetical protein
MAQFAKAAYGWGCFVPVDNPSLTDVVRHQMMAASCFLFVNAIRVRKVDPQLLLCLVRDDDTRYDDWEFSAFAVATLLAQIFLPSDVRQDNGFSRKSPMPCRRPEAEQYSSSKHDKQQRLQSELRPTLPCWPMGPYFHALNPFRVNRQRFDCLTPHATEADGG